MSTTMALMKSWWFLVPPVRYVYTYVCKCGTAGVRTRSVANSVALELIFGSIRAIF